MKIIKVVTAVIASAVLFIVSFPASAGDPSNTFPEEQAGMSAYTQLDDITESNNAEKLTQVQSFLEEEGSTDINETTHVTGSIPITTTILDENDNTQNLFDMDINIYFDISGWLVAYLDDDAPSSKIINWSDYTPGDLSSTMLERALQKVINEVGHSHSEIKYYHFQHPDATRFAIITQTNESGVTEEKNFSFTSPGEVYEASYSRYHTPLYEESHSCVLILRADNSVIYNTNVTSWCSGSSSYHYDFYPEGTFSAQTPHSVVVNSYPHTSGMEITTGVGTFILYGDE